MPVDLMPGVKRSSFWMVARWLVALVFVCVLWFQLSKVRSDPAILSRLTVFFTGTGAFYGFLVILSLTLLNYCFEAFKWRLLLRPVSRTSFFSAFKDVLTGILFSILTPARIGELAGRVVRIENESRLAGAASVLVGSIGQNIVIVSLGCIGAIRYVSALYDPGDTLVWSLAGLSVLVAGMSLLIYFNIERFVPLARKLPWPSRWKPYLRKMRALSSYTYQDLICVLALSFCRILVWSVQYLFIIGMLHPATDYTGGIFTTWVIFLLQTGIPLPPISGLVARSSIAVILWGSMGIDEWNALASSFVIYFYNLIIPSVLGLFVLLFNRKSLNENV